MMIEETPVLGEGAGASWGLSALLGARFCRAVMVVDAGKSCWGGAGAVGGSTETGTTVGGVTIGGGESGPGFRPMEPWWVEDLQRQCEKGWCVSFFVKQASGSRSGTQGDIPDRLWAYKEFPEDSR